LKLGIPSKAFIVAGSIFIDPNKLSNPPGALYGCAEEDVGIPNNSV
jgi:hypothetical protein